MLPKTPTDKKRLRQRRAGKDSDGDSPKINAGLLMSRSHTDKLLSDIQPTTLTEFDKYCPDTVSGQDVPEEDDVKCLPCLHDLQPVVTASCSSGRENPDCTWKTLFPELGLR